MRQSAPQPSSSMSELKNPILDIAASFWDDDRYRAFRVCYQSMRQLDDIVDDIKVAGLAEDTVIRTQAQKQLADIVGLLQSDDNAPAAIVELRETMRTFHIPLEPWLRLTRSMVFDLEHNGFDSFLQFARYARGAAVAPAAVFIHLIGLSYTNGAYVPAPVDIFKAARPLAMFSYLTHILRDFQKDIAEGLDYIPCDMKSRYGITAEDYQLALSGKQPPRLTELARQYHRLTDAYRQLARIDANPVFPYLDETGKFSLQVIWELYTQIHTAIEKADFLLYPELIHPSTEEIHNKLLESAGRMNVSTQTLTRGLTRLGLDLQKKSGGQS